jgi:hypothetical protein
MTAVGHHDHRFCLSLATLLVAEQLADAEPDEQRRQRKRTVALQKWSVLRDAFPDDLGALHGYGGTGPALRQLTQVFARRTADWTPDRRWLLLIDVVMSDPFAPYGLRVATSDFVASLAHIADALAFSDEGSQLLDQWRVVLRMHRRPRWRTAIAPSMPTPTVTTSGPDPASAAILAATAGFDGEAATARGVALLAGGSLGVGGSRYAGGLWLVTTTVQMDLAPDGGLGLLALGPAQARVELIKLQLTARLVIHSGLADGIGTDDLVDALGRIAEDLTARLDAEHRVNDGDAPRVTAVEAVLHAVDSVRRDVGGVETQAA